MDQFLGILEQHMEIVDGISNKIENREGYMEGLKEYLPFLNEIVPGLLVLLQNPGYKFEINQEFVLQVLADILYGVENEDPVFLLDVLRYGLQIIYSYISLELQGREIYE